MVCLPCWYISVGFEVLTAVVTKNSVFWYVTPCCLLNVNWRYGGTCYLHLQGKRISQARNQQSSACCLLYASFLLGLFFYPEDGGNMFLLNVSWHSVDYMALYPSTFLSVAQSLKLLLLKFTLTSLDVWEDMLLNPAESDLENSFLEDHFNIMVNDLSSIMTHKIILDGFISLYACSVHLVTKNVG
jgi:hypothetical protein